MDENVRISPGSEWFTNFVYSTENILFLIEKFIVLIILTRYQLNRLKSTLRSGIISHYHCWWYFKNHMRQSCPVQFRADRLAGRGRSWTTGLAGFSELGPNSEPRGNNQSLTETHEHARVPVKKIRSRDSIFGLINSKYFFKITRQNSTQRRKYASVPLDIYSHTFSR